MQPVWRPYDSFDLETRLYCLELLHRYYWSEPVYYPPQLIFADQDEVSSDDEISAMLRSLLNCGRLEEEDSSYIYNFNPTQNPEDDICRIIRPQKFYDISEISVARTQASRYRCLGYCPLHRHPELVEFIESLSSLYGGALLKCLKVVDFEAAKAVANSPRWMNSTKPHCTMLDHNYRTFVMEPALNIVNGMRRESIAGLIDQEFRFVECKGCRFSNVLSIWDILPVAQILGSEDLLPFILDSIQLLEMSRVRVGDRDKSRISHPSEDFWKSLTGLGPRFSAKEIQCLRTTVPSEMLGKERFDAGTLFEYLIDRFQFCRNEWGMNELPTDTVAWWKALYQRDCRECYERRSGHSPKKP